MEKETPTLGFLSFFLVILTLMSITSWPNGLMSGVLLLWMSTWHFILKFWESRKGRIAVEGYL